MSRPLIVTETWRRKERARALTRYRSAIQAGKCGHCRKRPQIVGTLCQVCFDKQPLWKARRLERGYYRQPHVREKAKWRAIKAAYGIGRDIWLRLMSEQGGTCAICREIPTKFVVDHDHLTQKVRGLLCQRCNIFLGASGEQPERFERAVKYLWHG